MFWPDSGLTRNTRALGYRCSVPGLAGFTGAALCGARSLITCQKIADWRLPIADFGCSNQRLTFQFKNRDDSFPIDSQSAIGNWKSAINLNLRLAVRHHPQQSVY